MPYNIKVVKGKGVEEGKRKKRDSLGTSRQYLNFASIQTMREEGKMRQEERG